MTIILGWAKGHYHSSIEHTRKVERRTQEWASPKSASLKDWEEGRDGRYVETRLRCRPRPTPRGIIVLLFELPLYLTPPHRGGTGVGVYQTPPRKYPVGPPS